MLLQTSSSATVESATTTESPGGHRPTGNGHLDHRGYDLCDPDAGNAAESDPAEAQQQQDCSRALHVLDYAPAPGWTVHVTKDGRLYYCNHVTRTAGWLPPAEAWKSGEDSLPYGWERAVDDSGRTYYINHVNKTTTYETPAYRGADPLPVPEPRNVTLERSENLGFGFVAGSEKPVIVRFVTEGGPSVSKLLPGDHILSVNGEDVRTAPREKVISMVRACTKTVTLTVCQPPEQQGVRKSTLLSATKKARLKNKPNRVRFAESVCVNGAPLFPPSAFSLGDMCIPPMANVLKVFLENGQTKSFKYDAWTSVQDVVKSLQSKLCITASEHFSLVVEHIKSIKRNKLTLLDPQDTIARIASKPGAHKLRCLFRVTFVPASAAALAQKDLNALDYLYTQCCNDVIQERFAPELQYDTALRLAALHIYQHALANNVPASKLTLKVIERDFGIDRFVPPTLLENMKLKEVRKLIAHFLKLHSSMAGAGKQLTALQAKLHYLDIVSQLPSYGAKCFSAGTKDVMERVVLVSPKFGISQITGTRNSVFKPVPIANMDEMRRIEVRADDEFVKSVFVHLSNDRILTIILDERDAIELVLVLKGYFFLSTGQKLPVDQEVVTPMDDLAPPYLSQHRVVPDKWSYIDQGSIQSVCFAMQPIYQGINKKTNGLYNTMGRQSKPPLLYAYSLDSNMNNSLSNRNHQYDDAVHRHSYDYQSVINMEILENGVAEARNDEVLRRVQEMHQLVENSEKYLTEQENLERLQELSEWQETSVDVESDQDEPKLKHSDSLTLLNKIGQPQYFETKPLFTNATIELLRQETVQSESDNDSLYTPHESPKRTQENTENNKTQNRISFGLRSPDNPSDKEQGFKAYLERMRDLRNKGSTDSETASEINYVFDPDIIDLTQIPPPSTPDELDGQALPAVFNMPPKSFADSSNNLAEILNAQNLDEFLANVTIAPPTQKLTPAIELTPEEIMAYIIPPPPSKESLENLVISEEERTLTSLPLNLASSNGVQRKNSNASDGSDNSKSEQHLNVIEYPTIERKGAFSCCSKDKQEKNKIGGSAPGSPQLNGDVGAGIKIIKPLPRRSLDEKPPDRPPKIIQQDLRPRSHSLTLATSKQNTNSDIPPPKLPPRGEYNNVQQHPHLFLPPKKPPLPPVPPLDVLRQKKLNSHTYKSPSEIRTASIGSPHLQRNRNVSPDLENNEESGVAKEEVRITKHVSTAVSTPTSPRMGRSYQMSTVPVSLDSPTNTQPKMPPSSPNKTFLYSQYQTEAFNSDKRHSHENQQKNTQQEVQNDNFHTEIGNVAHRTQELEKIQAQNAQAQNSSLYRRNPPETVNRVPHSPQPIGIQAQTSPLFSRNLPPKSQDNEREHHQSNGGSLYALRKSSLNKVADINPLNQSGQQSIGFIHQQSNMGQQKPNENTLNQPGGFLHQQASVHNQSVNQNHSNVGAFYSRNGTRENLLTKTDVAMEGLLSRLSQIANQCTAAQSHGGGKFISEEKFQQAKEELTTQSLKLVNSSKMLVIAMSDPTLPDLPENLAICLTILRRLTELSQDMANHTTAPLQTRNLILKVHDVTATFRHLVTADVDRTSQKTIEEHLAGEAESLANVLATLLRSLRVFSP